MKPTSKRLTWEAVQSERWALAPGLSGRFEVSTLGRVRRAVTLPRFGRAGEIVRTFIWKTGYLRFNPSIDGKRKTVMVHRLVAAAFLGPCPVGKDVAHGNGDRSDARLENLRYATRKENEADKIAYGTRTWGERNGSATLTDDAVIEIRSTFLPPDHFARKYGVEIKHISRVRNGDRWAHLPGAGKHLEYRHRGEDHYKAALNEQIVGDIRRRVPTEGLTKLAREYGVAINTVRAAYLRQTWRHVV